MNEQWVLTTLAPEVIEFAGEKMLVIHRYPDGTPQGVISPADFATRFAAAATPISAATLNAVDAGTMGYAATIAAWKAAGYIS